MKSKLLRAKLPEYSDNPENPHSNLAGVRKASELVMMDLVHALGMEPYVFQFSLRDENRGVRGWHREITPCDTKVRERKDRIREIDCFMMTDVDYYVDLQAILEEWFNPVILFTVDPKSTAFACKEYSYTVVDNELLMSVNGGTTYKHKLWDFSQEYIVVSDSKSWWKPKRKVYRTMKRRVGRDHSIVIILPIVRSECYNPWYLLNLSPLKRRKFSIDGFNFLKTFGAEGVEVHLSKEGQETGVVIGIECWNKLESLLAEGGSSFQKSNVKSLLDKYDIDKDKVHLVYNYLKRGFDANTLTVIPPLEAVNGYQFVYTEYEEKPAPMVAFMCPIVHGAFVPMKTQGNAKRAIAARVNVKPPKKGIPKKNKMFVKHCVKSFGEYLSRDGYATQTVIEEIWDKMDRPTQRALLIKASNAVDMKQFVSAFLKVESYMKYGDPRNISTVNPEHKLLFATYVYGLMRAIKAKAWFGCGKNPQETGERLSDLAALEPWLLMTDFSRMDGHRCEEDFEALIEVYFYMFPNFDERADLARCFSNEQNVVAYMEGVKYTVEYQQLSGSPATSVNQTLVNVIIMYIAIRRHKQKDYDSLPPSLDFVTHEQAIDLLGIYLGDDGVTPGGIPEIFVETASWFGHELKVKKVLRGEPGVEFLSRIYGPHLYLGDCTSICTPDRMLSKFHMSAKNQLTNEQRLALKTRAALMSDARTPIIGKILKRLYDVTEHIEPMDWDRETTPWHIYSTGKGYPQHGDMSWAEPIVEEAFGRMNEFALEKWNHVTLEEALYNAPCLFTIEPEPVPGVWVNGEPTQEIHRPPVPTRPPPTKKETITEKKNQLKGSQKKNGKWNKQQSRDKRRLAKSEA
jgi:hypothetical protein